MNAFSSLLHYNYVALCKTQGYSKKMDGRNKRKGVGEEKCDKDVIEKHLEKERYN